MVLRFTLPSLELTRKRKCASDHRGVPQVLDAELVVADLPEDVAVAHRDEVIGLIDSAVAGQRENALFGKQVVEFELAQLEIEPGAVKMLSKRTKTCSKWKAPVGSDDGSR
jgi:hypothetical protein